MTAITFTAANASVFGPLPRASKKNSFARRAALPDLDAHGSLLHRVAETLSHAALAAVPFAALAWLFIAR